LAKIDDKGLVDYGEGPVFVPGTQENSLGKNASIRSFNKETNRVYTQNITATKSSASSSR